VMRHDEPQLFVDQSSEVQVGEPPPVPDEYHAAKGEPFLEILDYIGHGRLVRGVAVEDVVAQRDPFGRPYHPDDHLFIQNFLNDVLRRVSPVYTISNKEASLRLRLLSRILSPPNDQ